MNILILLLMMTLTLSVNAQSTWERVGESKDAKLYGNFASVEFSEEENNKNLIVFALMTSAQNGHSFSSAFIFL